MGKEYAKAVYCHPAYLTYRQSTSCKMQGCINHKLELGMPGEISTTSDMRWYHSNKEESEKPGLKLNIQKTKIMASGLITSWQIDGEKVETVTDFIFLGSKITVDGECSHEIKRCLLLGRKAMTNLNSILKSRDIIFANKRSV